MSMSGIAFGDKVVETYQTDMKLNKIYRYMYLSISKEGDGQPKIVITRSKKSDKQNDRQEDFSTFCDELDTSECAWVVYDFIKSDNPDDSALVFFSWCPDDAGVKEKMKFASTTEAVKKALHGVKVCLQATDRSDLEVQEVMKRIKK